MIASIIIKIILTLEKITWLEGITQWVWFISFFCSYSSLFLLKKLIISPKMTNKKGNKNPKTVKIRIKPKNAIKIFQGIIPKRAKIKISPKMVSKHPPVSESLSCMFIMFKVKYKGRSLKYKQNHPTKIDGC